MWPFGKRKRREAEQDAEYQAFLENHQKQKRPPAPVRAPPPRTVRYGEPTGYAISAAGHSGISCTYAAVLHEGYPHGYEDQEAIARQLRDRVND